MIPYERSMKRGKKEVASGVHHDPLMLFCVESRSERIPHCLLAGSFNETDVLMKEAFQYNK
jgi:hypothetical protein